MIEAIGYASLVHVQRVGEVGLRLDVV